MSEGALEKHHSVQVRSTMFFRRRDEDMGRRRLQREGHLYKEGAFWKLRWREDAIRADGTIYRSRPTVVVGPAHGPGALTEKQASRVAWEQVLSKLDQFVACPASMMTLEQYVNQKFEPEFIWTLKHAGKLHYAYCLKKILPVFGNERLRDVKASKIQLWVKAIIEGGLSIQTAAHFKNAMSAIFEHAKAANHYAGENPARLVRLPEKERTERSNVTYEQARAILTALPLDIRAMAMLSMTTSLNVAELCGLRWKRLNLSAENITVGQDTIPPLCLAVRENYYRNRWGTVKTGSRNRMVPVPDAVIPLLDEIRKRSRFTQPEHPVFAARTGRPVDAHNTNNRLFKRISEDLSIDVTWHIFRHSCASFAESVGMAKSDRVALMGHSKSKMTDHYTHSDLERRRGSVNEIAKNLSLFWPDGGQEPEWKN